MLAVMREPGLTFAAAGGSDSAADAGGGQLLMPFWMLFYPWVFVYLGAFLLRGGSGSEGLLANVRDILWIPDYTGKMSAVTVIPCGCELVS